MGARQLMRTIRTVLTALLFIGAAYSQPAESKVFHFANTETPHGFQELVNTIRAITAMQQVSLVMESKALAVRGTAAQVSVAEWLFRTLDQKPGASSPSKGEFAMPGAADDLARVFYIPSAGNPQNLQEIVNAVRSVMEVQRVATCTQPMAIAMRGTSAQIVATEWLIRALDRPSDSRLTAPETLTISAPEFYIRGANSNVAKVLYATFMTS